MQAGAKLDAVIWQFETGWGIDSAEVNEVEVEVEVMLQAGAEVNNLRKRSWSFTRT